MSQSGQLPPQMTAEQFEAVKHLVYPDNPTLFPPSSNPTDAHKKTAQAFEFWIKTFKRITDRRQIWAADSFTAFSTDYVTSAIETMSRRESNRKEYVRMAYMEPMKEHMEWCGRKLVPGFEGDVVARWSEKMDEVIQELLGEFKYSKE